MTNHASPPPRWAAAELRCGALVDRHRVDRARLGRPGLAGVTNGTFILGMLRSYLAAAGVMLSRAGAHSLCGVSHRGDHARARRGLLSFSRVGGARNLLDYRRARKRWLDRKGRT